jgi:hypothetical protein
MASATTKWGQRCANSLPPGPVGISYGTRHRISADRGSCDREPRLYLGVSNKENPMNSNTRKPITVHQDGTVELRLSPAAWRCVADIATTKLSDGVGDAGDFLSKVNESIDYESAEPNVERDSALLLTSLAVAARSVTHCYIADSLELTLTPEFVDTFVELGEIGPRVAWACEDNPNAPAEMLVEVTA